MNHDLRFTAEKIGKRIELVRAHIFREKAPFPEFTLEHLSDPMDEPGRGQDKGTVSWDSYWAGQDTHFVLRSQFTVPEHFTTPALFLPLGVAGDIFTHPEALLHIDGALVASADRYHQLVLLEPALADGKAHQLLLKGWTGLTGWPPDPNNPARLQMQPCFVVDVDPALRNFVVLSETALDVANTLPEGDRLRDRLLTALDSAFRTLDTRAPMREAFRASIPAASDTLRSHLQKAGAQDPEKIWAIGHAHMDIAYLWPVSQIRQKNGRTYANVLRLMERHPGFHFSHSQPQLYDYTEQDFPEVFDAIHKRVEEGRWEVMGGMWVEADCNIPGGEALARQLLLGRQYFKEKFGDVETPVLWLPDTFGFPWSLPQLMKLAGLKYFVTNKLNWNQYNRVPSSSTWWQGIDGTRVLAQFLTTPRQVQHLPFPTNYKSDLSAAEVMGTVGNATSADKVSDFMIAYGYGDGGGGPTDELVLKAKAYADIPGIPELEMGRIDTALERLAQQSDELPTWNGEFYLEGHRGTLTSQAWIKRANRQAERALHDAEAALATAFPAGVSEDIRKRLTVLWQRLCLNQFHDVLTGTSVPVVFEDARKDYAWIMEGAQALLGIAHQSLDGASVIAIFNSAPVASDPVIFVPNGDLGQPVEGGALVPVPPIPAYGANALGQSASAAQVSLRHEGSNVVLANEYLKLTVNADGTLTRILHLPTGRDALEPGAVGNQLWAYEDRPLSWDAWDIDVFHDDRAEKIGAATSVNVIETGPLRCAVRITHHYRQSTISQTIRLTAGSPRLEFDTEADWQERHILLKAMFPVDVLAPRASYEIQWGEIERPTHRNTRWDFAQFEVPAQKWANLSEGGFGVALLNDCKHGYSIRDNNMHLTLIKSSTNPDPHADLGHHRFTYALLPHGDDMALVRAEARRLNNPVLVVDRLEPHAPLVSCASENVMIETLKPAEDGNGFILRLYESDRRRGTSVLGFSLSMQRVSICDLLENDQDSLDLNGDEVSLPLKPFEIVTLRCIPA